MNLSHYMLATLEGLAREPQHWSTLRRKTYEALLDRGLLSENATGFCWPSKSGRLVLDGWRLGREDRKVLV